MKKLSLYVRSLEAVSNYTCKHCGGKLFYSTRDTVYIHWPSLSYFCDENPTSMERTARPKLFEPLRCPGCGVREGELHAESCPYNNC